jgi:hypothetical protein
MKLLCSSSDLRELKELVKRLVRIGIPCAVCKDSINSQLSVWIQQDNDFPLALKIFVSRDKPRALPPWASLLDSAVRATEDAAMTATKKPAVPATGGMGTPSVVLVQSKGPTLTGTTEATAVGWGPQPRRTKGRAEGRHRAGHRQGF